jgi:poly(3-hydroxybutyrate) depolymerase
MDDVSLLVQRALEGSALSPAAPPARPARPRTESRAPADSAGLVIDGVVKDRVEPRQGNAAKVPASRATRPTAFTESNFVFEEHTYPYRLFVPALTGDPSPMPLIVLLHGCTQDAQDFARGTSMNDLAGRHGCMVLYPEQISKANSQRCWNWYERDHQQLGRGEPGMIAALTQQVLAAHQGPKGADQQATERIIYRSSAGPSYVEYWRVGDGQHAWSGGDAAGSFTDPDGPSASAAMLEFFLQHKKA